jgi:hypothetical protein
MWVGMTEPSTDHQQLYDRREQVTSEVTCSVSLYQP